MVDGTFFQSTGLVSLANWGQGNMTHRKRMGQGHEDLGQGCADRGQNDSYVMEYGQREGTKGKGTETGNSGIGRDIWDMGRQIGTGIQAETGTGIQRHTARDWGNRGREGQADTVAERDTGIQGADRDSGMQGKRGTWDMATDRQGQGRKQVDTETDIQMHG